jgi:hypothetical protein
MARSSACRKWWEKFYFSLAELTIAEGRVMAEESVVAVYEHRQKAVKAVESLLRAGIAKQHISAISRSREGHDEPLKEDLPANENLKKESKEKSKAESKADLKQDAAIGAGVGGVLGSLVGVFVLSTKGLSVLTVAGALASALGGAASGSLLAFLAGFLARYGASKGHAARHGESIASARFLVVVRGHQSEVGDAHKVLEQTRPYMLHAHVDASEDDQQY